MFKFSLSFLVLVLFTRSAVFIAFLWKPLKVLWFFFIYFLLILHLVYLIQICITTKTCFASMNQLSADAGVGCDVNLRLKRIISVKIYKESTPCGPCLYLFSVLLIVTRKGRQNFAILQ